ncbi:MAG TPA: glycosyltransferase [bacterium]|nr:glycosyltransferase [bacterium]
MPPQPILFIAREFTNGGAAYQAVRLMERLRDRYAIDFLIAGPAEPAMLAMVPPGVSVFELGMGHPEQAAYSLGDQDSLGAMELILRRAGIPPFEKAYHAVLATSVFPNWRAALAVSLVQSPRKLVCLVDEALLAFPRMAPREKAAVESCLLSTDLLLPVSNRLRDKMAAVCPLLADRPWERLYAPIDAPPADLRPPEPAPPRDLPLVLTIARLVRDKQVMECVQVQDRLRAKGIHFRWVVLGEGPEEGRIREAIAGLGLQDRFLLAGHQPRVYDWLAWCDLFVLFSKSEGGPTVVREALRAGKPVVVTDVNGADEMVEEGQTGFILPDDPAALEETLGRLLRAPQELKALAERIAQRPPLGDALGETARLVELIESPRRQRPSPEVSILIPTYNQAPFLDQAISSALMQTFPSLEVVVLDDASQDETPQVAQKWKADPRFRYLRNDRNLGRVANYRKAVAECARGEWVLMLDGDDYLIDPDFIRRAKTAIEQRGEERIVFAQAGHRARHLDGSRPEEDILPDIQGEEALVKGGDYLRLVFRTGFFSHLGILFNRAMALRHGVYTADILSSDMDSFLRLATEGEVLLLKTAAGCWVQHGANASSHPPLEAIAPNVRIFRSVAQKAVRKGLLPPEAMKRDLSAYEARTLAFLFNRSLARSGDKAFLWLKIWSIALSVNPGLIVSLRFILIYLRLVRKSLKRRLLALWKGGAKP